MIIWSIFSLLFDIQFYCQNVSILVFWNYDLICHFFFFLNRHDCENVIREMKIDYWKIDTNTVLSLHIHWHTQTHTANRIRETSRRLHQHLDMKRIFACDFATKITSHRTILLVGPCDWRETQLISCYRFFSQFFNFQKIFHSFLNSCRIHQNSAILSIYFCGDVKIVLLPPSLFDSVSFGCVCCVLHFPMTKNHHASHKTVNKRKLIRL